MQKSPFTLKNSDYIVLFHCQNANSHLLVTAHLWRMPDRTSSIASIFCDDRREHISVTVRPRKNHALTALSWQKCRGSCEQSAIE